MATSDPNPLAGFRCTHSAGLADLLRSLNITVLATTYQAGKLMALRGAEGRVSTLLRGFERPMGLAVRNANELALGTRSQVWLFRNAPEIAWQIPPIRSHDACFLPRLSYVTGDIRCHEMAWGKQQLWIVNTFFSCLCTVSPDCSFVPRWVPPFLAAPAPGDHCHLNGLAMVEGKPRYISALGESSTPQGWRSHKADGGILLDVAANAVVYRGLSMPHSPRWHEGKLWFLESGTGQLQYLDTANGHRDVLAELPGFARGLAFFGPLAFIGLSKIRETSTFGNLPIARQAQDLRCGIWVLEWKTGKTVEFIQFDAGIEEIFAVEVLEGYHFPEIVGFQQDTVHGAFVVPAVRGDE